MSHRQPTQPTHAASELSLQSQGSHTSARLRVNHVARGYLYIYTPACSPNDGRPPLLIAAENGHVAIVPTLIEAGADAKRADDTGRIPLAPVSLEVFGCCDAVGLLIASAASRADGFGNRGYAGCWVLLFVPLPLR